MEMHSSGLLEVPRGQEYKDRGRHSRRSKSFNEAAEPNFVLSHRPFGQQSYGSTPLSPRTSMDLQNGNVLDTMEKEQEGIVLKLMREIDLLKEENRHLKLQLSKQAAANPSNLLIVPTASSLSSQVPYRIHSLSSSTSSVSSQSSTRANNGARGSSKCDTLTNRKRMPSTSGQSPISSNVPRYPSGLEVSSSNRAEEFKKCRLTEKEFQTDIKVQNEMFVNPFKKNMARQTHYSNTSPSTIARR
ncbi:hypothetical protein HII12_001972 [Brettanomyces bruxellensis]|uniref:Uncharacterized protein n=1 Tax=Dekkera bruxellensis TaxID=5007 RepID=A0A8H6BKV6_DEKBR|nr:hypothetical protein HII12_001972 [Brettanomyces bruxellensis]